MANFTRDSIDIHYDEYGSGFPLLLIAPGGMRSAASFWESTPWNPITQMQDKYRVIAMDQRNAGRSNAPISADDNWRTYTADQLALMDHLGCDQFCSNMYDGDNFLFNVDRDFVANVQTPLLVLLGNDLYHPESSSRIVHDAAPNSTLIEDWMEGAGRTAAMEQFAAFLAEHTP